MVQQHEDEAFQCLRCRQEPATNMAHETDGFVEHERDLLRICLGNSWN
jgi:hypothetical protein